MVLVTLGVDGFSLAFPRSVSRCWLMVVQRGFF
jgi:hypothetical protein